MLLWWWCGVLAGGPPGAPPTFLPAWAMNSNTFIGITAPQPVPK
jgi:hypothetical protein